MIVVLGAFGRTGRVTAGLLELAGCAVRRVTRSAASSSGAPAQEVCRARLSDELEVCRALKGARAVYAMLPDDLRAESFRAERRNMAETITRAIRRERVPRVVLLSSAAAALGEHGHNGLGAELAYFERLVLDTTATVSVLRASYFQDNLASVLESAAQAGQYLNFFASRETAIATIATLDVGKLAAQVLLEHAPREPEIVDLVGPSYSVLDMAAVAGELLGRSLSVVDVPALQQEQAFGQWMSAEAARAMVETFACLSSGRAVPQAARVLRGQTRLDQVLRAALTGTTQAALGVPS